MKICGNSLCSKNFFSRPVRLISSRPVGPRTSMSVEPALAARRVHSSTLHQGSRQEDGIHHGKVRCADACHQIYPPRIRRRSDEEARSPHGLVWPQPVYKCPRRMHRPNHTPPEALALVGRFSHKRSQVTAAPTLSCSRKRRRKKNDFMASTTIICQCLLLCRNIILGPTQSTRRRH